MKLLLIKHGKTDYNLEGKRLGRTDISLNEQGRKETEELRTRIILTTDQKPEAVISSPLKRTLESAQILFPDQEIIVNDLLIEYDFGELEGVPFSTPLSDLGSVKIEKYNGINFIVPRSGETFEDIKQRCQKFIRYLEENFKDKFVAVVTHSTNMEILKALLEGKEWSTYLGQAKEFHGVVEIGI